MQENPNFPQIALKQIQEWIKDWEGLKPEDLKISRLTGITNRTYRVKHENQKIQPECILLRVFGHDVEGIFINRDEETLIYNKSAEVKLGPKIYGYNKSMRGEEWIHSQVLQQSQMNQKYYRRRTALHLNKFHQQKITGIDTKPLPQKVFDERVSIKCALDKFNSNQQLYTEQDKRKYNELLSCWTSEEEITFLKGNLPKNDSSIVFSHNDLLANNILINEQNHFFFIDFEYSCYNYRTFDIANYFMESLFNYDIKEAPFFEVNYDPIPNEDLKDFIKYYAYAQIFQVEESEKEELVNNESYFEQKIQSNLKEFNSLVDEMMEEMPLFMMFSNYFWGIWGVFSSKNPLIEFDYVEFAYAKFKIYNQIKQRYFGQKL